jgi:hypothetical protein
VKRCPTCNKTFTDRNLSFCIDDGTPLAPVDDLPDELTVVSPSAGESATESDSRSSGPTTEGDGETVPPYQPPGSHIPPGSSPTQRRKVWPWILGLLFLLLLVIVGLGTAAWFYLRPLKSFSANTNTANRNANVDRGANANGNSNNSSTGNPNESNANNNQEGSDTTEPPTDESVVLADLTNLEHEWTVANINADKKKLNRILADDYVGTTEGSAQGKADYLRTVTRDDRIQKWEFDDLKVSLKGDRATLTGILRLKLQDGDAAYRFVDKFVWRDGRWQATSSEVTEVKQDQI